MEVEMATGRVRGWVGVLAILLACQSSVRAQVLWRSECRSMAG